MIEKDEVFEIAERYVNCTGRSVFLTGKAGTGKTTFLKHIAQSTLKRFVILAPTGVAAINAGGSTIHSFFQLPLCPYLPDVPELVTEYQTPEKYRSLRKERQKMIRTLDLLIIDEISMVRADLLDAVDATLRRYRNNDLPFGGVQLLMIGDAQQLSPVVKENERPFMEKVYPSPYFFYSKALQKLSYVTIELQKVYRQKDAEFLELLNAVRENRVTQRVLDALNSRLHAYDDDGQTIRLTTHNAQSDSVNMSKLEELPGKQHLFEADVEDDFPEHMYPADKVLVLKEGAQVMFIRNDSDGEYYNGKLGKVVSIKPNGTVEVEPADGGLPVWVSPVEWENIQYVLNDEGEIVPSVLGKFRQLPLRVAWAITIHKSQGLTFDRVIIDAGAAFAFGQVYVALSRCRSLEGISLESPVRMSGICSDSYVAAFNAAMPSMSVVSSRLPAEEEGYRYDVLCELFDLSDAVRTLARYRKLWAGTLEKLYDAEYRGLIERVEKLDEARGVAVKFIAQLRHIQHSSMPDDAYLNERIYKASGYFLPLLNDIRDFCSACSALEVDSKEVNSKLKDAYDQLAVIMDIKHGGMTLIRECKYTIGAYCRLKTSVNLEDRKKSSAKKLKRLDAPTSVNEELRERLMQWRMDRFKKDNVPAYMIMHQTTLLDIATYIPQTKKELLAIKGFGETSFKKYGEEILAITAEFASTPEKG
jgi:hypothetical protein